jgi:hypothetical protein
MEREMQMGLSRVGTFLHLLQLWQCCHMWRSVSNSRQEEAAPLASVPEPRRSQGMICQATEKALAGSAALPLSSRKVKELSWTSPGAAQAGQSSTTAAAEGVIAI